MEKQFRTMEKQRERLQEYKDAMLSLRKKQKKITDLLNELNLAIGILTPSDSLPK